MSRSYGLMVAGLAALEWMETKCWPVIPEAEKNDPVFALMWSRCINRFRYEIDKSQPVPVKVRKGRRTDYSCSNCGRGIDVNDKYCPGCGTHLDWNKREVIELK